MTLFTKYCQFAALITSGHKNEKLNPFMGQIYNMNQKKGLEKCNIMNIQTNTSCYILQDGVRKKKKEKKKENSKFSHYQIFMGVKTVHN